MLNFTTYAVNKPNQYIKSGYQGFSQYGTAELGTPEAIEKSFANSTIDPAEYYKWLYSGTNKEDYKLISADDIIAAQEKGINSEQIKKWADENKYNFDPLAKSQLGALQTMEAGVWGKKPEDVHSNFKHEKGGYYEHNSSDIYLENAKAHDREPISFSNKTTLNITPEEGYTAFTPSSFLKEDSKPSNTNPTPTPAPTSTDWDFQYGKVNKPGTTTTPEQAYIPWDSEFGVKKSGANNSWLNSAMQDAVGVGFTDAAKGQKFEQVLNSTEKKPIAAAAGPDIFQTLINSY